MASTGPKGITNAALKRALRKHAGLYAQAARELGCDRTNVMQRVNRSPDLQAFCASIVEEIGDAAEGVIYQSIIRGEVNTALAYARMKLRDRGYSTRTELANPDGSPLAPAAPAVNINVSYVDGPGAPATEDVVLWPYRTPTVNAGIGRSGTDSPLAQSRPATSSSR